MNIGDLTHEASRQVGRTPLSFLTVCLSYEIYIQQEDGMYVKAGGEITFDHETQEVFISLAEEEDS